MKNYLDLAQNFIDIDKTVPDKIFLHLNEKEQRLITNMMEIGNQLKMEIDQTLPEKELSIIKQIESGKRKFRIDLRILYTAAALLAVLIYFPISESIETKILLKEETIQFVDQLFQEDNETYIFADLGITSDWFNSSIISDFQ